MYLFHILLLSSAILQISGLYTCTKVVPTPFQSKDDFIDCFSNSIFFNKYIEVVKGNDIEFIPPVGESQQLQFPQIIKYRAVPDIPFIPRFMLSRINIHQKWNKTEQKFVGEIKTKFLTFDLTLTTYKCNDKFLLNMQGKLTDKISLLPNNTLDILIEQFGDIFQNIMNNKKN